MSARNRSDIQAGALVQVVQKQDQRTGKLTEGIVKDRRDAAGLTELEGVIVRFGRQLFGEKRVSSEVFARALKIFGPRQLVELVSLMANYSATAALLRAFDMQLSPGKKPLLPLP